MQIDGARILVTGGCGFIGSTTIDLLLEQHAPAQIVILDNLVRGDLSNIAAALKDPRVSLIRGDIRDAETVGAATRGMDAVIHMATLRITACAEDAREAFEVMCTGTFNVVEAARSLGVKRVLAASSASVYGMAGTFPTSEDHHPYNNRTWYGATKTFLEGLLRSFNDMYSLSYVALRYFNVYGPRMDVFGKYTEVLIRWMERIDAGEPPIIFGDGSQTMDFVHVHDVARANVLALRSDVADRVYNVGSGSETSLLQLLDALLRAMGREDLRPEFQPARAVNPVPRRLADVGAAQRDLGFSAEIPLPDGLEQLVRWRRGRLAAAGQPR
ncbi:NAD-dependent epimerase/dehydratase family protein [Candidatus Binatia bacterium]|nr:NAD-dependent epimerase/dehydratase family protein [Candidatus Binatia bacterium]